jgi:hypothetical protein
MFAEEHGLEIPMTELTNLLQSQLGSAYGSQLKWWACFIRS